MTPLDLVVSKVLGARRQSGGWYLAKCPAHEDRTASLSVKAGRDGRALVRCFAGCTFEAIVDALDLQATDLFPPRDVGALSAWARKRGALRRRFAAAGRTLKATIFGELLEPELERERRDQASSAAREPFSPLLTAAVNGARARVAEELGITVDPLPPFTWECAPHDADPLWPALFARGAELALEDALDLAADGILVPPALVQARAVALARRELLAVERNAGLGRAEAPSSV